MEVFSLPLLCHLLPTFQGPLSIFPKLENILTIRYKSLGRTARSGSLSWGAREVGSPCEWRGVARHCSRVMGGESGLETC